MTEHTHEDQDQDPGRGMQVGIATPDPRLGDLAVAAFRFMDLVSKLVGAEDAGERYEYAGALTEVVAELDALAWDARSWAADVHMPLRAMLEAHMAALNARAEAGETPGDAP
jgi:hypothetical protein